MLRTYWNPGDSPVVVDDAGRTIAGREFGTADTTDDLVKAATADGRLLEADAPPEGNDSTSAAREAHARTAEVASRAEKLGGFDKDKLQKLADDSDVRVREGAHKDELVRELAYRLDVSIPSTRSRKAATDDNQEG